jgi:Rps23 Pro-64 3,4-dihydroxylase Tpa1-like proline 4-hydroxylase
MNQQDINNSDISVFGDWINKDIVVVEEPFTHIVIDNFLKQDVIDKVFNEIPVLNDDFYEYYNPLEIKYVYDKIDKLQSNIKNVFYALSHTKIIDKLKHIFNIDNLEYDPLLHGAGIHLHPNNGRLHMHLDYEKHPILENKQRILNIILYLNKQWKTEWNGDTQLWDKNMSECKVRSYPEYNKAIIFKTSENSWHGVPDIIKCSENEFRKTLAFYYIKPLENTMDKNKKGANINGYRQKAVFTKRPFDVFDEKIDTLYKIRPYRRITNEDLIKLYGENYKF